MKHGSRILLLTLLALIGITANAQQFEWDVDFGTIFDNREGSDKLAPTKTTFQTILAPEAGLSLENGKHRIMGGVVWTQPIGCEWDGYHISPTLYYRFNSPKWRFSFGMFPRTQLLRQQPNVFWCDSLRYNQRNIRGALVQYVRDQGFFEAFIDWRSMQSHTRREAFNINASAEWSPRNGIFNIGAHAMMNHFAKSTDPQAEEYIVDNIIANPYVGIDLTHRTALDSLSFKAGAIVELLRYRMLGDWQKPCGFWLDAAAEWRFLGIKNSLYVGDKLFLLYPQFGAKLDMGEPFFQSKLFNRTDVYAYIIRNNFMNLEASLNFFVAEEGFAFSQKLLLRVYLDRGIFKKNQDKTKRLKNIY